MKIKKKRKITKEELKRDKVEETILSFFDIFKKDPKKISGIFIILFVVIILIVFLTQKRTGGKDFQGERIFIQALTFLNGGELQKSEELFKQIYNNSRNSIEGKKSIYYLGHLSFLKGDLNEAERYFKEYISSKSGDEFLTAAAEEGLSEIYFSRKEKDKAIKSIENAIKIAPFKFQKSYYFLRKVEMLKELENNKNLILNVIKENEDLWKDSPFKDEITNIFEYIEGTISAKGG